MNAAELGLLASQGYTTIPVYSKPRVVVLSTGNELVPHHASKVRVFNFQKLFLNYCTELRNMVMTRY